MKRLIQTVLSLAGVAFYVYLFAFFIDGDTGASIIVFLLLAPLFSLAFTLYGRSRIRLSIRCDAYVNKGSELLVTVRAEKNGRLPLGIIDVVPDASEVFEKPNKKYRLSMFSASSCEFSFSVKSKTGGNGSVFISRVYCCGFLGFMRFKAKTPLPEPISVGVVPTIPDIKTSTQLFRAIADVVMTSDNEEDNDTSMLFSANTQPGYEHREYVHGDPMKRINWKLSSKKSKLMVRLDEAASSVQPLIVLDLYRRPDADPEYAVITEEKLLRSVFGLLSVLVKRGIACQFMYFAADGSIASETVDNPDYPAQLLLKVLAVPVVPGRRLDIGNAASGVCSCLIATTDAGKGLTAVTDKLEDKSRTSILGVSAESANDTGLPLWYLDEDENYKMV